MLQGMRYTSDGKKKLVVGNLGLSAKGKHRGFRLLGSETEDS
jgi:hypothetical protein